MVLLLALLRFDRSLRGVSVFCFATPNATSCFNRFPLLCGYSNSLCCCTFSLPLLLLLPCVAAAEAARVGGQALTGGVPTLLIACEATAAFQTRGEIAAARAMLEKHLPCDFGLLLHAPPPCSSSRIAFPRHRAATALAGGGEGAGLSPLRDRAAAS